MRSGKIRAKEKNADMGQIPTIQDMAKRLAEETKKNL